MMEGNKTRSNKTCPAVSVIVPVFGVQDYIEDCFESLMQQTLTDIEYIIVDDCTQDQSIEIAKRTAAKYPDRACSIRWLKHNVNRGLTASRNTGLKAATGEYIYHCDSDDRLDPTLIEKLYNKAKGDNLEYVWCDFYIETNNGIKYEHTTESYSGKVEMMKKYLTTGWNVVWNTLCKRSVYETNNIKSLESISFGEDFELMARLFFCAGSWGKVTEPLYFYNRKNPNSIVSRSLTAASLKKTTDNGITAVLSICDFIKQRDARTYHCLKRELHWIVLNAKKFLCFSPYERKRYLSLLPECHEDIDTNPLCGKWHKAAQHFILKKVTSPIAWGIGLLFKLKNSYRFSAIRLI